MELLDASLMFPLRPTLEDQCGHKTLVRQDDTFRMEIAISCPACFKKIIIPAKTTLEGDKDTLRNIVSEAFGIPFSCLP